MLPPLPVPCGSRPDLLLKLPNPAPTSQPLRCHLHCPDTFPLTPSHPAISSPQFSAGFPGFVSESSHRMIRASLIPPPCRLLPCSVSGASHPHRQRQPCCMCSLACSWLLPTLRDLGGLRFALGYSCSNTPLHPITGHPQCFPLGADTRGSEEGGDHLFFLPRPEATIMEQQGWRRPPVACR